MKQLFAIVALVTALGLMSFSVAPNRGVKRIGDQLYKVDLTARFTDGDLNTIGTTLCEQYQLGQWGTLEETVALDPKTSAKGKWILHKKLNILGAFEESFIKYDTEAIEPGDQRIVDNLNAILARY
jgi:hypothetical protein